MKETRRNRNWLLLGLVLLLAVGLAACDENGADEEAVDEPVAQEEPLSEELPLEAGGQAAVAPELIRASFLTDLDVVDENGETIAEVEDALLGSNGALRFLVIDATPLLGAEEPAARVIGWETVAFELAPAPVGRRLVFEGDLADAVPADPSLLVEDDDYLIEDPGALGMAAATEPLIQLGDFTAFELLNGEGADLGDVEEIIVDLVEGEAAYAVVDVGGFLELGEREIAVPWAFVAFDPALGAYILLVDTPTLEDAPTIDLAEWEFGPATEDWSEEIDAYWEGVAVG